MYPLLLDIGRERDFDKTLMLQVNYFYWAMLISMSQQWTPCQDAYQATHLGHLVSSMHTLCAQKINQPSGAYRDLGGLNGVALDLLMDREHYELVKLGWLWQTSQRSEPAVIEKWQIWVISPGFFKNCHKSTRLPLEVPALCYSSMSTSAIAAGKRLHLFQQPVSWWVQTCKGIP